MSAQARQCHESEYHTDPALSQSQAKVLLHSPAQYKWQLDHPHTATDAMRFGSGVHDLLLQDGANVDECNWPSWQYKEAKSKRADSLNRRRVPMLTSDLTKARAMVAAVTRHPAAATILAAPSKREQSIWWERDGVPMRARVDILTDVAIVDYKTTVDASPDGFARSCAKYGYHIQAANYIDAVAALTGATLPFILIAQEKQPPYLVGVYEIDPFDVQKGADAMERARALYRVCTERDEWPAFPDATNDIQPIQLPAWAI